MTNATFLFNNIWDSGTLTASTEFTGFGASNTRRKFQTESWRSSYGASEQNGNFVITTSNQKIDFEETGAVELTATLTPGTYTKFSLGQEIVTQLEAIGDSSYTFSPNYLTGKVTITSNLAGGGNVFNLLWDSGSNKANSIADTLGFDDSADDTGAGDYTADNIRIHTGEWLKNDMGSAKSFQAFAIKHHNFQSGAVVKFQAHTADSWSSPDITVTVPIIANIMIYYWSSVQSKRWVRTHIVDIDNPNLYSEMGRIYVGPYMTTTVNFRRDYSQLNRDPSSMVFSDGGQLSADKKTKYISLGLVFEHITFTELETFRDMWETLGYTTELFFTRDRDKQDTTTYYMRITNYNWKHIIRDDDFTVSLGIEELR